MRLIKTVKITHNIRTSLPGALHHLCLSYSALRLYSHLSATSHEASWPACVTVGYIIFRALERGGGRGGERHGLCHHASAREVGRHFDLAAALDNPFDTGLVLVGDEPALAALM
jgi:hypothetical protein